MRREILPNSVSPIITFQASQFQNSAAASSSKNLSSKFGHYSQDGSWAWIAKGTQLDVYSACTGRRCSAWNFGATTKKAAEIFSVVDFYCNDNPVPYLIVALDWEDDGGLICIFDVKTSKILKAIEITFKIRTLEVISTKGGICIGSCPLNKELKNMFGVIAIGTVGGYVIFVDLCLDEENYSDELSPNQVSYFAKQTHNIPARRASAVSHSQHLCFVLNDESCESSYFFYKNQNDSLLSTFSSDDVTVTSVKYFHHLATLAVGFNFGGLQLWNMQHFSLEYSTDCDAHLPIVKIAFQEPENDPRNFCYLWVVRGSDEKENRPKHLSTASLYCLTYLNKEWLDNCGFIYQGLQNCYQRFQYDLSIDPHNPDDYKEQAISRLISCYTIPQADILRRPDQDVTPQEEDCNHYHDLSICVLAWEVWQHPHDMVSKCFLAFFDINQYYKVQMPPLLCSSTGELCPYIGVFSLSDAAAKCSPDSLLDVHLSSHSLVKYKSLSTVEEFFFPSSVAFSLSCLSSAGSVKCSYWGIQRQLLSEMTTLGPDILVDPKDMYNCCVYTGLLSLSHENEGQRLSVAYQREMILNIALQNNMSSFLATCVQRLSSGEFNHVGLTLKSLMDWVWKRITFIKTSLDKLFLPLFNCSGQPLGRDTLQLVYSYNTQLRNLSDLLWIFQNQSGPISEPGQRELTERVQIVNLIITYLEVILWLYDCCLLPEHMEGEEYGENEVAYPTSYLVETYSNRRKMFESLHSSVGSTDVLLIDGFLSEMGPSVISVWEKYGSNGLYPPPSLLAAIGTYLINGISHTDKHCMMLYLLMDLANYLSDRQSHLVEKIVKFSNTFNISHGKVKLIEGFWLLDNQIYDEAITTLLNPMISPTDILPWQHTRILKSFLYKGEHQKALKYSTAFHSIYQTSEDIKLRLSILLANGLVAEALYYVRQYSTACASDELLCHLFIGCQETCRMDTLLQLPLSPEEKQSLVDFLYSSQDPKSQELLVLYYLLQGQPVEATRINAKITAHNLFREDHAVCRNALLQGYFSILPEEQRTLSQEIKNWHQLFQKHQPTKCPKPLSSVITRKNLQAVSYSDVIYSALHKIAEACTAPSNNLNDTDLRDLDAANTSIPFIGTPLAITPKRKSWHAEVEFTTPASKRSSQQLSQREFLSPKKSRFGDITPIRTLDFERRRSQKHLVGDAKSLLQIPPVCRRSLSAHTREPLSEPTITPQSILKVKNFTPKPISEDTDKIPPVIENNLTTDVDLESTEDNLTDTSKEEVSKQIRFEVPQTAAPTENSRSLSGQPGSQVLLSASEKLLQESRYINPLHPLHTLMTNKLEEEPEIEEIFIDDEVTIRLPIQNKQNIQLSNDMSSTMVQQSQNVPSTVTEMEVQENITVKVPRKTVVSFFERPINLSEQSTISSLQSSSPKLNESSDDIDETNEHLDQTTAESMDSDLKFSEYSTPLSSPVKADDKLLPEVIHTSVEVLSEKPVTDTDVSWMPTSSRVCEEANVLHSSLKHSDNPVLFEQCVSSSSLKETSNVSSSKESLPFFLQKQFPQYDIEIDGKPDSGFPMLSPEIHLSSHPNVINVQVEEPAVSEECPVQISHDVNSIEPSPFSESLPLEAVTNIEELQDQEHEWTLHIQSSEEENEIVENKEKTLIKSSTFDTTEETQEIYMEIQQNVMSENAEQIEPVERENKTKSAEVLLPENALSMESNTELFKLNVFKVESQDEMVQEVLIKSEIMNTEAMDIQEKHMKAEKIEDVEASEQEKPLSLMESSYEDILVHSSSANKQKKKTKAKKIQSTRNTQQTLKKEHSPKKKTELSETKERHYPLRSGLRSSRSESFETPIIIKDERSIIVEEKEKPSNVGEKVVSKNKKKASSKSEIKAEEMEDRVGEEKKTTNLDASFTVIKSRSKKKGSPKSEVKVLTSTPQKNEPPRQLRSTRLREAVFKDVESVKADIDTYTKKQDISFNFTQPKIIEVPEDVPMSPSNVPHNYIFSTPLTRSKTRQKKMDESYSESSTGASFSEGRTSPLPDLLVTDYSSLHRRDDLPPIEEIPAAEVTTKVSRSTSKKGSHKKSLKKLIPDKTLILSPSIIEEKSTSQLKSKDSRNSSKTRISAFSSFASEITPGTRHRMTLRRSSVNYRAPSLH